MTNTTASTPRAGGAHHVFISMLGLGQICSWGSLYYAFPLLAGQIETEFGWSRTDLYGAATAGLILGALASFPIGRAIDQGHGRAIMAGGSVLAGLLLLAWAKVGDLFALYIIVGLLGVVQAGTLYEAAFAVIARRVGPARARPDITALTLWGGFASTAFIPLVQVLVDNWGWRGAVVGLGVINIGICATLYGAAISPQHDAAQPAQMSVPRGKRHVSLAIRRPVFWLLALAFTAHAAAFTAFTFHLYPMLLERGFAVADVVMAMALIGPAQVGGRIGVMFLARKAPMRVVGSATVAVFPLAFMALAVLPPTLGLIAGVTLVYGAANGIVTIVRGAAVPEMLTQNSYGAVSGAMNTPATIARAIAPLAAASLWTVSQSYQLVILAILAGSAVLAIAFWSAAVLSKKASLSA